MWNRTPCSNRTFDQLEPRLYAAEALIDPDRFHQRDNRDDGKCKERQSEQEEEQLHRGPRAAAPARLPKWSAKRKQHAASPRQPSCGRRSELFQIEAKRVG